MEEITYFDLGLKDNWREFKRIVQSKDFSPYLTTYYFVFNEDDCDEAHVFHNQDELDKWLERTFWDRERYDTSNIESAMDDYKVWMLVDEERYENLNTLYKGARLTSIIINGKRQYRKLINVSCEPTIIVSTNWY